MIKHSETPIDTVLWACYLKIINIDSSIQFSVTWRVLDRRAIPVLSLLFQAQASVPVTMHSYAEKELNSQELKILLCVEPTLYLVNLLK